jgi:hypothetical protein
MGHCEDQSDHVQGGRRLRPRQLRVGRSFFRVRFGRLTPKEKHYLRAMAELGLGPRHPGDIATVFNKSTNSLGHFEAVNHQGDDLEFRSRRYHLHDVTLRRIHQESCLKVNGEFTKALSVGTKF